MASADTIVPINWTVNASTTLKSLNLSVTVPPGNFVGQVDLTTGALTGNLTLPAGGQDHLAGRDARWPPPPSPMKETGPITGHVDLATQAGEREPSFSFSITSATLSLACPG